MHNALIKSLLLITLFFTFGSSAALADTFFIDSFEGTAPDLDSSVPAVARNAANHTSTTDGSSNLICGNGDYFFRTTLVGEDAANGFNANYSGNLGANIWRGEDLDGCTANPDTIEWTGIDISGRTNLIFSGLFAARDTTPFETGDSILVEYQIDGGGYLPAISFVASGPSGTSHLFLSGSPSTILTLALTEYTFNIPGAGSSLDIRVTATIDGGSEEFAWDYFQVGDDNVLPVELQSYEIE